MNLRAAELVFKKIQEELDTHTGHIIGGTPQDFASYRYEVGYIKALNTVIELYQEAERETNA